MTTAEQAYLFRHAVVRDAAYSLQLPGERALLHQLAIQSFESLFESSISGHAEELVAHAQAAIASSPPHTAGPLREAELRYLCAAADHCRENWRLEREIALLRQLIVHPLISDPERARRILLLAKLLMERGEFEPAAQLVQSIGSAADGKVATEAALLGYRIRVATGRVSPEDTELDELLEKLAANGDSPALVNAMLEDVERLERGGARREAITECVRATDVARRLDNLGLQAECALRHALLLHRYERAPEAEAIAREALQLAREAGDRRQELSALNHLGIIQIEHNRLPDADRSYEAARAIAHEIGAKLVEATVANNHANLHFFFFGNIFRAERQYLSSLEYFRECGEVHSIAHANGILGLMYVSMGRRERARDCFNQALQGARVMGDRIMEAKALRGIAVSTDPSSPGNALRAYAAVLSKIRETAGAGASSDTWMRLGNLLLEAGLLVASEQAFARSDEELKEGHRQTQVSRFRLHVLRGMPAEDPESFDASLSAPHHRITDFLLPRFLKAAAEHGLASATDLHRQIHMLAETFEATGYLRVREALEHTSSVVAELEAAFAAGREPVLWRGFPPRLLAPALRGALLASHRGDLPDALAATMRAGAKEPFRPWDTPLSGLPELGVTATQNA